MEYYPPPKGEITAEEVLMKLIRTVTTQWNGNGAKQWAQRQLQEIREPEQLLLFRGEDE